MIEANPYRLEEAKWTPGNVYDIIPPNALSYTGFEYSEGSDNVDEDKVRDSLLGGFIDFFGEFLGTAGRILGGALELGGAIFSGFVNGVINFVGGVANAIGSIFGGPTESPYPPMFSPIKANLEASIQPLKDQIQDSQNKSEELLAEQVVIRGQIAEQVDITRAAVEDAKAASERAGVAIGEAEAASAAATEARETLESYNTELNKRITSEFNAAVGRADTAVEKADTLAGELADFQAQHQIEIDDAIGKAEQAVANVNALSPQVADAVAQSAAATDNVAALTPQVSEAVSKAGEAVDKAGQTLEEYTAWAAAQKIRIDSAVSEAEAATANVATLTPQVADAVAEAGKATSDVSALTPKVSAAQSRADSAYAAAENVRTEIAPKIEAAQTKGENALAVADTAVDWLKNPVEIGSSLISINPETKRPYYAEPLELVDDNPPGTSGPTYMSPASMTAYIAYGPSVPVDSKIKYTISFWAKAAEAGSKFWGQLRTQEGRRVAPDGSEMSFGAVSVSNPPQPSNKNEDGEYVHNKAGNSYFIQELELQTEWTYYEHEIQFAEGVTSVSISTMYWNHDSGTYTDQYISGLDIRPQIPTQASVDKAQNDAIKANADILVQQGLINEAQRVANLAQKNFNDNQKKWSDGVDVALATQETVNDNFSKWSDGATTAIEANTKALAIINSRKQGNNIVPVNPVSGRPWFAEPLKESTDHPPLTSGPTYYSPAAQTSVTTHGPKVEVDPKIRYTLSFWAKASKTGSVFYGQLRSQEGRTVTPTGEPLTKGGVTVANPPQPSNKDSNGNYVHDPNKSSYFVSNLKLNTKWTYYETEIQFNEGVTAVSISRMYWSHTNGIKADQYISGLSIRPQIPTQAQVDAAQNTALEAHDLLFEKQDEWNDGTTAALIAQKTVDDNFKIWSDGAAEAIEANKNAIKALNAPQMGTSVIPLMPGTQTPAWTANADGTGTNPTNIKDGDPTWYKFDATRGPGSHNVVAVDSTLEYDFSVWIHGTTDSVLWVELRDQDGNHAVKTGGITGYGESDNNGWDYLIRDMTLRTGWRKLTTTIILYPGVKFIKVASIYGNHSNGVAGSAYLADMRMVPHVPTQASVDKAQNEAIAANTEALKALGKKALGASLVPYKTPSTKEVEDYAAGKLDYDPWAEPEYINAGGKITKSSKGRTPEATAGIGTVQFEGSYVTVDSNIWHKVKFKTWASTAGSRLVVYMYNQNNDLALAETPFADGGRTSGGLVHYITLPNGWKEWEGIVKFSQETTSVRLGTFFWNHPTGTATGRQFFMDLEIVPNIPDANVVNELQDNAIRKNTEVGKENKKAIDALTEGMDAYVAAADLEALHKDIQTELETEQDARAALAAEINDFMVESIPRTIIYGSGPQFNDHISAERYKVVAKPGWVGQMLLDVTYVSKSDGTQTKRVIRNYNVPDTDGSREYDVPNASFGGYQPSYRLDYWIYRGESVQKALSNSGGYITGSSFTRNSWTRIATHTIKKSNGAVHILWRTRLTRADRGVTYSFDVRVNGTSVLDKHYKGYGPLTSFGSGGATLSFSGNLSVPDNGRIDIYAKANGTTNQASVSSNKGTLTYLELEQ